MYVGEIHLTQYVFYAVTKIAKKLKACLELSEFCLIMMEYLSAISRTIRKGAALSKSLAINYPSLTLIVPKVKNKLYSSCKL